MTSSCSITAQSGLGRPAFRVDCVAARYTCSLRTRIGLPGRGVAVTHASREDPKLSQAKEAPTAAAVPHDNLPRLQSLQYALQNQQAEQAHPTVSMEYAKSLAEIAMLAAVSGLGYTLATLLKLDSYLGYFLPLPVIIAAMRSGPAAARKTVTATCFLLIPMNYLLMHGSLAWCLGTLWHLQSHWSISVIAGSMTRLLGQLGYLAITSWTLNENLFNLLLGNVFSLLDQITGGVGTPSPAVVTCFLLFLFAINTTLYMSVMHLVYIPLLRSMGYQPSQLPRFVQKLIARRQSQIVV